MKFAYVKIATFCPEIKVGAPQLNLDSVICGINMGVKYGVELLVMPELCLTGYTCGDLFYSDLLISSAKECLKKLIDNTKGIKMLICVGLPYSYNGRLYNVGAVICNGKLLALVPKTNLKNTTECESRYFSCYNLENTLIDFYDEKVVFGNKVIFKDIDNASFSVGVEISTDFNSVLSPSTILSGLGVNLFANLGMQEDYYSLSASCTDKIVAYSGKLNCGYAYANAGKGESTTDCVYTGNSVIAENGSASKVVKDNGLMVAEIDCQNLQFIHAKQSDNQSVLQNIDAGKYQTIYFNANSNQIISIKKYPKSAFVPEDKNQLKICAEKTLDLQVQGLSARIKHTNCKSLVLGLSGGLDSTLAIIVAVQAMKKLGRDTKEVIAVTMPCFGTTSRTKDNSIKLAKALGTTLKKVDITKSVLRHLKDIKHSGSLDVTYENAQARERTQVLMDISNMTGGLVVGTGDLSELALGWATYNGDHMSMYGVNCSLPKTLVRHVVEDFANKSKGKLKAVLLDILDTPVSPELLPAENGKISQKTEDIVGPYILHDFYLYHFVVNGFSPEKIYLIANQTFKGDFSEQTILKWLKIFFRRFFNQQFKRSCLPDGVKVSEISLSPRGAWKMPSDSTSALWLENLENL